MPLSAVAAAEKYSLCSLDGGKKIVAAMLLHIAIAATVELLIGSRSRPVSY